MSLVGFIWDNVGRTQAFTYSTITGVIATVLASFLVIRAKRKLNKEKQASSL
jgi:hypothetical protein